MARARMAGTTNRVSDVLFCLRVALCGSSADAGVFERGAFWRRARGRVESASAFYPLHFSHDDADSDRRSRPQWRDRP